MRVRLSLCFAATLALAACGGGDVPDKREGVRAVGSSTVYPFAVAVADALKRADPALAPATIESTGTGEGIAAFCAGPGLDTPDVANASRRMTAAEFADCKAHGVTDIVELQVGLDGIVFASKAGDGIDIKLTPPIIYQALAARPYGHEQKALKWSDIEPSLPAEDITVYGPPESSGTRTALVEMALNKGCESRGLNRQLKDTQPDQYRELCSTFRNDSAFIAQGEHDDVTVRKVAGNRRSVAIFGYSYAADNPDKVKALAVGGVVPNAATITDGTYPLARPLYIYVKKSHLEQVPGLKPYVEQWTRSWGKDGPLEMIGLVPSHEDEMAKSSAAATGWTVMTGEGLH